jgi:hypothetical protein
MTGGKMRNIKPNKKRMRVAWDDDCRCKVLFG